MLPPSGRLGPSLLLLRVSGRTRSKSIRFQTTPEKPHPQPPSSPPLPSPSPPPSSPHRWPPSSPSVPLVLVSGQTRSKTVQLEEPPPSKEHQASTHRAGLLSMIGKKTMLSVLNTREVVDGLPHEELRRRLSGAARSRHLLLPRGDGIWRWAWGILCAIVAMLATHEEIDAALDDQRPPNKPPPHRYSKRPESSCELSGGHGVVARSPTVGFHGAGILRTP